MVNKDKNTNNKNSEMNNCNDKSLWMRDCLPLLSKFEKHKWIDHSSLNSFIQKKKNKLMAQLIKINFTQKPMNPVEGNRGELFEIELVTTFDKADAILGELSRWIETV